MKITISPGETLRVDFSDSEYEFKIIFKQDKVKIVHTAGFLLNPNKDLKQLRVIFEG